MENLDFWLAAGGMTLGVAALLVLGARAGSGAIQPEGSQTEDAAPTRDVQVYRDQLRGVEADLARGTLAPPEAERLRTEIARRLLDADRRAHDVLRPASRRAGLWVTAAAVVIAGAAALYTYDRMGLPGYPDMPLATRLAEADQLMALRPGQADYLRGLPAPAPVTPDADYMALLAKLRAAVDPATATDPRGLALLSRNEAALGNYDVAIAAQTRLIAVLGAAAPAADHATLAELFVRQAQGYVSPEAETQLTEALRLDPRDGLARYYTGLMFAQGGRYDRAFLLWKPLVEDSPADAPWLVPLRAQITEVGALAGVDYAPPDVAPPALAAPPLAGPNADDVAAAADLSGADRAAMIEGMVAQISERLAREGGSAAEWAQLIRALGVLNRQAEIAPLLAEAREIFKAAPQDLDQIEAAAKDAGAAE